MNVTLERLTLAVVLIATVGARAQTVSSGFELEQQQFNPGAKASLVTKTGDQLDPGRFRVSLLGHYERYPLIVRGTDGARLGAVIGRRATGHLLAAFSPVKHLELGISLPLVLSQRGDDLSALEIAPVPSGVVLGQTWASVSLSPWQQTLGSELDFAFEVMLGIPTGATAAYASDSAVALQTRIGLGRAFGWFRIGAEVGAHFRPAVVMASQTYGRRFNSALTLTTTNDGLRGEISGQLFAPLLYNTGVNAEILAGLRYGVGMFEIYAMGGKGFGGVPGNPSWRVFGGIALRSEPEEPEPAPAPAPPPPPVEEKCVEGKTYPLAECPALDFDSDGIRNGEDECPEQKGLIEKRGCPLKDGDGDGIEDEKDACPNEAGPGTPNGCPLKDSDGDGVMDNEDDCPNQVGIPEAKGCPPKAVQVRRDKLVISQKIFFSVGGSKILAKSQPLINEVAAVLKEHTEVGDVVIEGHTDSTGQHETNMRLSERRAESVRQALIKAGVPSERLRATGYGPDQPVETNETAQGREQNRRVEFKFVNAKAEEPVVK